MTELNKYCATLQNLLPYQKILFVIGITQIIVIIVLIYQKIRKTYQIFKSPAEPDNKKSYDQRK